MIKRILSLTLPAMFGSLGIILFETIDIFWIGRYSSMAVAGVAGASFLSWGMGVLTQVTLIGTQALVAQYRGSKQPKKRDDVIVQSFHLTVFLGLLMTVVAFLVYPSLLRFMGLNEEAFSYADEYLGVVVLYHLGFYLFHWAGSLFNAFEDNKLSNGILFLTLLINAALDPLFIFGWEGYFPQLGVYGAAYATVVSYFIGLILRLLWLKKKKYLPKRNIFYRLKKDHYKPLLNIGVPTAFTNLVWVSAFPLLTPMITQFGMIPLAALNVANRIEGLAYFTAEGFAVGVSAVVAFYFGQGNSSGVLKAAKTGLSLLFFFLLPVCLIFIFYPHVLMGLLNSDPEIIAYGSDYLRIIGYFELFLGLEMALEGAFNGLSRSPVQMWVRVPLTLLRVPLAYVLIQFFDMGVDGVWWAITLSTFLKGLLLFYLFFYSRWGGHYLDSSQIKN